MTNADKKGWHFFNKIINFFSEKGMSKKTRINIIGAGVVGLTTGLVLQRNGYQVTIIAEHWPSDYNINYTSPCAGAFIRPSLNLDEKGRSKLSKIFRNSIQINSFSFFLLH